jgi:hypothetical protein
MITPPSRPTERLWGAFQQHLVAAIVDGSLPTSVTGLGTQTLSAIEAIARDHPEAQPELIVEAHNAFTREHADVRAVSQPVPPAASGLRRVSASRAADGRR